MQYNVSCAERRRRREKEKKKERRERRKRGSCVHHACDLTSPNISGPPTKPPLALQSTNTHREFFTSFLPAHVCVCPYSHLAISPLKMSCVSRYISTCLAPRYE